MASLISQQIRPNVQRYLDGEIELPEFEDWFTPVLWDIESFRDDAATELAGKIHILTAEYSRGDRSLESLRLKLANAVRAAQSITI